MTQSLNELTPKFLSGELLDTGYSVNLNAKREPDELAANRAVIGWLTELDNWLTKAKERDFDLLCDDEPEERGTNRYMLSKALNNLLNEEQKGSVSFPVDHLTKLRWATGLLKPWSIDEDTVDLTDEQSRELNRFFENLSAAFDVVAS